jgi:hypothetical protein
VCSDFPLGGSAKTLDMCKGIEKGSIIDPLLIEELFTDYARDFLDIFKFKEEVALILILGKMFHEGKINGIINFLKSNSEFLDEKSIDLLKKISRRKK